MSESESKTKKDLTSLLELPKLTPDETSGSSFEFHELPTGEETGIGEEPAQFHTSTDQDHFGPALGEVNGDPTENLLEGLPPIDPEVAAIAEGTSGEHAPEPPPASTLSKIRNYAENVAPVSSTPAAASTPYSLLIEGALQTHEKEQLLQIISREKLGIREVELEPQFAAGRVLIPRISEYAGVLLVHALRSTGAQLKLGPSDTIFARADAAEEYEPQTNAATSVQFVDDRNDAIFAMPITSEATLGPSRHVRVIDTLHGSLLLQASQVNNARSAIVQESIERLKQQLKLQAHYRGANGIVSFRTELQADPERAHYTILAQGVAVRSDQ